MYEIEATFHQGTEREYTLEETVKSLATAVRHLEVHIAGKGGFGRVWINNREIRTRHGSLIGGDGERFCTNQKWHDRFAPLDYPKIVRKAASLHPIAAQERDDIERKAKDNA